MDKNTFYIFVYGTLKKGYRYHTLLKDAKFIQNAKTIPFYRLYDCGLYPCLIFDKNGENVEGEIYQVSEKILLYLDEFEDVPNEYKREFIKLLDCSLGVQAYIYQKSVKGLIDCGESWPTKIKVGIK